MKAKKRNSWLKFIGYRPYCLPEVTDHLSFIEAINELPYPLDFWWLEWMYEQGGRYQYGIEYSGETQ